MVYVVITAWYPLNKAQQVNEIYNKQIQEMGSSGFIKSTPMWIKPCKTGMKTVTYNEIEEGKLEEAITWLLRFMGPFGVVDGYGYDFDLMASQQELIAATQQQQE